MVSQLEFVHPETRAPLRRGDVESLERAVQKQGGARRTVSVLRAFELEKEERECPESTARAGNRAASSAVDTGAEKPEKEAEDGWVTTKSRARRAAPTATREAIGTHLF